MRVNNRCGAWYSPDVIGLGIGVLGAGLGCTRSHSHSLSASGLALVYSSFDSLVFVPVRCCT